MVMIDQKNAIEARDRARNRVELIYSALLGAGVALLILWCI
jgi:hypothetical protein